MAVNMNKEQHINNVLNAQRTGEASMASFIQRLVMAVMTFVQMLRDRDYRFPGKLKGLALLTILYAISPIDLVPDFLFPIGIVDDFGMLLFFLRQLFGEVEAYQESKKDPTEERV